MAVRRIVAFASIVVASLPSLLALPFPFKTVMLPMRDNVTLHTVYNLPCLIDCKEYAPPTLSHPLRLRNCSMSVVVDRSPYGEWDLGADHCPRLMTHLLAIAEVIADAFLPFGLGALKQDIRGVRPDPNPSP